MRAQSFSEDTPLKHLNAILVCGFRKKFPKPFDNFGLGVPAAANVIIVAKKARKKHIKNTSPAAKTLPDVDDLRRMQRSAACAIHAQMKAKTQRATLDNPHLPICLEYQYDHNRHLQDSQSFGKLRVWLAACRDN